MTTIVIDTHILNTQYDISNAYKKPTSAVLYPSLKYVQTTPFLATSP